MDDIPDKPDEDGEDLEQPPDGLPDGAQHFFDGVPKVEGPDVDST